MSKKFTIALIFFGAIIAIGFNIPNLPSTRYQFKDVDRIDAYTNYAFSTMVYDTWTGKVKYVAEGTFEKEENGKNTDYSTVVGEVLNYGKDPDNLLIERYIMLSAEVLLLIAGVIILLKIKD
jgi:hypothetical protein